MGIPYFIYEFIILDSRGPQKMKSIAGGIHIEFTSERTALYPIFLNFLMTVLTIKLKLFNIQYYL